MFAFFLEQLKVILTAVYAKPKVAKALTLLPVTHDIPEGAETAEVPVVTEVGMAKIVSDRTTELPDVGAYVSKIYAKRRILGDKFSHSVLDIQKAQFSGVNITATMASIARKAIEQKLEKVAWVGDADYNLNGFANYPGIPVVAVSAGASGSTAWSTKTPKEIIKDIGDIYLAFRANNKNTEEPTSLLLPSAALNIIKTTMVSDNSVMTILSFINTNYNTIMTIDAVEDLDIASADKKGRGIMFVKTPETVRYEIPQPFTTLTPQDKGLLVEVPCYATTFGVIVELPYNVLYIDGIT